MRPHQRLGGNPQLVGAGEEVGLVRLQEAEHGTQHFGRIGPRAQVGGVEPGHVEEPPRAAGIGQCPGERIEREAGRIGYIFGAQCDMSLRESPGAQLAGKVLVVEDNELNLKLFCDLLRAHDYAAEPVRDGREAVERARAFRPDLIVMDIQMPHVTGYDLLLKLADDAELREIPVMAVTAYAGREDEDRIRAAGAKAYVSKPITLQRFMNEVKALA